MGKQKRVQLPRMRQGVGDRGDVSGARGPKEKTMGECTGDTGPRETWEGQGPERVGLEVVSEEGSEGDAGRRGDSGQDCKPK